SRALSETLPSACGVVSEVIDETLFILAVAAVSPLLKDEKPSGGRRAIEQLPDALILLRRYGEVRTLRVPDDVQIFQRLVLEHRGPGNRGIENTIDSDHHAWFRRQQICAAIELLGLRVLGTLLRLVHHSGRRDQPSIAARPPDVDPVTFVDV